MTSFVFVNRNRNNHDHKNNVQSTLPKCTYGVVRISMRGATRLVMFTGNMNAIKYGQILETGLVPFLRTCFPDGARLQQDNDPKHSSKYINRLFKFHNINWWKTPPESPDLNPIENCWGSLKQYLRTSYKPTNLEELIDGIERFWLSLTPAICRKYIEYLHKVP